MPTTKNAQLRFRILDRCFSDFSKMYSIEDLQDAINGKMFDLYGTSVSIRSIRYDISYMRDRATYNAPIEAYNLDGKKCYYRYSDPDFSIFKSELTIEDANNLQKTIEMLGRYRGVPANAWLEEVISNLEYRFGVKSNSENLISFEQNTKLKGLENLSTIIDNTINHNAMEIEYCDYKGIKMNYILHPYHVKQYNNRWFLFGLDDKNKRISNLALDRIKKIKKSNKQFIPNTYMDFNKCFDDILGVTIPKDGSKKEIIELKFTSKRFPYVLSKPIHMSQKVLDYDNCVISINVITTLELEQNLFSFGPDVTILAPEYYRKHLEKKIEENLKKYSSMQEGCTIEPDLCINKR